MITIDLNKSLTTFFVLLFASVMIPSLAIAQTTTPTTHQDRMADHCSKVTSQVNNLSQRLSNDDNIRENRHQKVIDRLNTIIAKLKALNINTDKLTADVTTLTTKKNTWDSAYQTLLTDLTNTKNYGCGTSNGQFAAAVKTARAQRETMHQANVDFWSFVTNTVIPDVRAARDQIKAAKTTITPAPTK